MFCIGLKRLSHEGSTYNVVDFNSPEVDYFPVCSVSLDHRGCYKNKSNGILCHYFGGKKPRNAFYFFSRYFPIRNLIIKWSSALSKLLRLLDKFTLNKRDAFLTLWFLSLYNSKFIYRDSYRKQFFFFHD